MGLDGKRKIEESAESSGFLRRQRRPTVRAGGCAVVAVIAESLILDCLALPVRSLEVADAAVGCTVLQRHCHPIDAHGRYDSGRG